MSAIAVSLLNEMLKAQHRGRALALRVTCHRDFTEHSTCPAVTPRAGALSCQRLKPPGHSQPWGALEL